MCTFYWCTNCSLVLNTCMLNCTKPIPISCHRLLFLCCITQSLWENDLREKKSVSTVETLLALWHCVKHYLCPCFLRKSGCRTVHKMLCNQALVFVKAVCTCMCTCWFFILLVHPFSCQGWSQGWKSNISAGTKRFVAYFVYFCGFKAFILYSCK